MRPGKHLGRAVGAFIAAFVNNLYVIGGIPSGDQLYTAILGAVGVGLVAWGINKGTMTRVK